MAEHNYRLADVTCCGTCEHYRGGPSMAGPMISACMNPLKLQHRSPRDVILMGVCDLHKWLLDPAEAKA